MKTIYPKHTQKKSMFKKKIKFVHKTEQTARVQYQMSADFQPDSSK